MGIRFRGFCCLGLWCCLLAFACGEGEQGNDGGSGGSSSKGGTGGSGQGGTIAAGPLAMDGFVEAFTRASCELLHGCLDPNEDALALRALSGTVDECTAGMLSSVAAMVNPWIQGVTDGDLSYDADAARRCVNRVPELCGVYEAEEFGDAFQLVCKDVFEGDVAIGGACRQDVECAGSAVCGGAGSACGGTCQEHGSPGAACDSRQDCSAAGADGAGCVDGSCISLSVSETSAGADEPCGLVVNDDGTGELTTCAAGLWCKASGSGAGEGTCVRPTAAGAECFDVHEVCEDGAVCLDAAAGMSCTRLNRRMPGESCGGVEFCDPRAAYCSEGECVALGDGSEGSTCLTFSCKEGLRCDIPEGQSSGLCAALLDDGEACQSGRDCASGQCDSSGADLVCVPAFCP
ncbi:hypothetical protein WME97_11995 [Sorangium sp. So ce367]|uniref:hypothetical protein n=1 Tax=Sorangium sp. So ce367 TaxID=3133305 RepID=UPI003F606066